METKKVTVGIAVYNEEEHIEKCLLSILNQTFPLDDIEIICVNDGSTDSTPEILDSYAEAYEPIKVIHQENSGGPGKPRNTVIDLAVGEFIFFVDSDDFLGAEAIERMYNMAVENKTDVVLGKMKGVNGRGVPKSMFKKNQPRTDIYKSNIIYTLSPLRLIRTDLLRRNNLRFPDVKSGEDQPFMMQVYLLAKGISIVSDYDCYYAVKHDGEHASAASIGPKEYYENMGSVIESIYKCAPNKRKRDFVHFKFMKRHLQFSRTKSFVTSKWNRSKKEEWFAELKKFLIQYLPEPLEEQLPFQLRLRTYLIKTTDFDTYESYFREENQPTYRVENGNVYAYFESLKDVPVPKDILDYSEHHRAKHYLSDLLWDGYTLRARGWFYHENLDNQNQQLTVVFKNRETGEELKKRIEPIDLEGSDAAKLPDYAKKHTGFDFEWKIETFLNAAEPKGPWDLFIDSEIEGYTKRGRIGSERSVVVSDFFKADYLASDGENIPIRPYYTKDFHNLTVDVGGLMKSVGFLDGVEVKWNKSSVMEIEGSYCLDFINPFPEEPDFSIDVENNGSTFHFPVSVERTDDGTNVWHFRTKINLGRRLVKKINKDPVLKLKLLVDCGEWKQEASEWIQTG